MAGSDTWNGKGTNWLTSSNWSAGTVPLNGTIASETVIIPAISGSVANSPTLDTYSDIIVPANGNQSPYQEYQLDGMNISIGSGADLTFGSTVLRRPGGTGALITTLHTISSFGPAVSSTPVYDKALTISGTGNATLSMQEDNHNFAAIQATGTGNSLNIIIASDGTQPQHFLDNYGLIEASNGGIVTTSLLTPVSGETTAFANDGWIVASGGTFATNSAITDDAIKPNPAGTPDGYIEISNSGEAILTGAVAAKEEVTFLDTTSNTLEIGSGTLFSGTVNDFGASDELLISGAAAAGTIASSFNTAAGVLTVSDTANGVTTTEQITFTGTHPSAFSANLINPISFSAKLAGSSALDANSSNDAIVISGATACFAAGARILTAIGQVAVEDLIVGDEVLLANGGRAPIIWIGHRSLSLRRHNQPETVLPVLIEAGALGGGLPLRNLTVSPDHALYLEGCLIPAKALINGATIRQITVPRVIYYHVELPQHDVLYAEGVAAESYLETGNRGNFDNGGVVVTLHPDFAQTIREQQSCAPFIEDGPLVEAARQKILDNAGIDTTDSPAMFIRYRNDEAVIHTRSAIPGHIFADPRDRRRLGVKISALEINGVKVAIDHPALRQGWHGVEADGRWTDGKAIIPKTLLQGSRRLRVTLAATLRYPLARPERRKAASAAI